MELKNKSESGNMAGQKIKNLFRNKSFLNKLLIILLVLLFYTFLLIFIPLLFIVSICFVPGVYFIFRKKIRINELLH